MVKRVHTRETCSMCVRFDRKYPELGRRIEKLMDKHLPDVLVNTITAPVIFLDIDGVLNCQEYFEELPKDLDGNPVRDTMYPQSEIDPNRVKLLNEIIRKTWAVVVISSSWRHGRSIEDLQDILNSRGFSGVVVGKTPDLPNEVRGKEIQKFINEHSIQKYIIIDDDKGMLPSQLNNFILTRWMDGLTPELAEKAIQMLS